MAGAYAIAAVRYWCAPVLLSLVLDFIMMNKPFLPEQYFRAGLYLSLLAIGNSLSFGKKP